MSSRRPLEPFHYNAIRADHIAEPGIITSQVIRRLNDSPLVIADLSGHNPNVFYELAVRHAANKPLIQLITKGEQIPFDVSASRTIIDDLNDLDTLESAKEELAKAIRAIESKESRMDNPITVAIGMKLLRESPNPEQRSIAEVLQTLSDLRSEVHQVLKMQTDYQESMFALAQEKARRDDAKVELRRLQVLRREKTEKLAKLEKVLRDTNLISDRTNVEAEILHLEQDIRDLEERIDQLRYMY